VERLEDRCCPSGGYTFTDLGTLGGANSIAYAINSAGQVVGGADNGSTGDAFLWTKGGTDGVASNPQMKDLGTLAGDAGSQAKAVNDSGQVVGYSVNATSAQHAFIWQSSTGMKDLGNLGGSATIARGINTSGQVVGEDNPAGVEHAWLWQSSTGMTDLNSMIPAGSGWVLSSAWGINDSQQIVGQGTINGQTHGFLWKVGSGVFPTDLGALVSGGTSQGTAINRNGQVAGISSTSGGLNGFLWTPPPPGTMTDLAPLQKDVQSHAWALNDMSPAQVVGESDSFNQFHAVLWQNGKVTDLTGQLPKGSSWALQYAYGVNHNGLIVGQGQNGSSRHAFLLTPSSGQAPMAAAIPSLGNRGISPADLGGRTLRLPDETGQGANGQAAFNDAGEWSSILDATLLVAFLTKATG
jgi:probable HAF family extracellular repeat protein